MSLPTFTPSLAPSPGSQIENEVSLHTADFGDGYTLEAPRGLNHIRRVVTLTWRSVTPAQASELDAFFAGQGGYKPFLYQPYGFDAPVKWTCREWSTSTTTPISFTAKLRQNFTL